tara:strand:- start:55 stop:246 length:192 start_codon:yes stop_codon:yes gene_type:complete
MSKKDLNTIKVKQIKSLSGIRDKHKRSVKGLGLRKINHIVEVIDSPENRGMINKVNYVVKIIE